jgi:sirohydrochlorin ferrochelatase
MTAPALVLLAAGASDSRSAQVAHTLRKRMQILRPNLSVQLAFAGQGSPTPAHVASTLGNRGVTEIVFVSLDLTHATELTEGCSRAMENLRASFPDLHICAARPIGPATELLNILDERLRMALRASHAVELDGLVLAVAGAGDLRGNSLIARRARQWSAHHRLPCAVAFADGSGPSTPQAMATLRSQGRRHIAVGTFAIGDDDTQLCQSELALAAGAEAVSAPLGADDRLLDLVMARYSWAAMSLLDDSDEDTAVLSMVAGD